MCKSSSHYWKQFEKPTFTRIQFYSLILTEKTFYSNPGGIHAKYTQLLKHTAKLITLLVECDFPLYSTCRLFGRDILESNQQSSKGHPTASSVSRHHFNIIAVYTENCRAAILL